MITLYKLEFTDSLMSKISETIKAEPGISRRQLSRRICEWMDWRSPNGKLKEMSCRKALVELKRRKLIDLPECRQYAFKNRGLRPPYVPALAKVSCSLDELGPVVVVPITTASSKNSRIWNALLDSYHYLKSGPLCGAQLRYLIWSERYGWLGGLSFSAAAWAVRCRDEFIGWSEEARSHTLQFVVNNSRFLIVPTVKVAGLASHVLAMCARRLADDWQKRYSYRPVLLETFVDPGRFTGASYRAANWQYVGRTSGRGRNDAKTTVKDVYIYPLCDDWKERLCTLPDGTVSTRPTPPHEDAPEWVEEEFGAAQLGDRRRVERLMQLGEAFFAKPTANIPQACGTKAAVKAAYRFFDNEHVSMEAILAPHFEATVERTRSHPVVLVVQDTTSLNYTSHPQTAGIGPIGTTEDKSIGLLLHDTMAFTPEGTPLGLMNVQCWARDPDCRGSRHERHEKPIEEKESFRWIESYRATCMIQKQSSSTNFIVMADREADIYELFFEHKNTPKSANLLIRAEKTRSRAVIHDEEQITPLWSYMNTLSPAGIIEVTVPPRQDRPSRTARLEIRFGAVTIKPPRRKAEMPQVELYAVYAKEIDAPSDDISEPVEWMLLTSLTVTDFEQAKTVINYYTKRWGIEVYHRVLKSGCRIEDRQLGTARRLENCLAIDMVVAWRIHHLTWLGRQTPELPCTIYFEDAEWKALVGFINQTPVVPATPPTLREAINMVARLGGFLNRKSDGEPGTETIWRGLQRLDDITKAYIAFVLRPQQPPPSVSSNPTYG